MCVHILHHTKICGGKEFFLWAFIIPSTTLLNWIIYIVFFKTTLVAWTVCKWKITTGDVDSKLAAREMFPNIKVGRPPEHLLWLKLPAVAYNLMTTCFSFCSNVRQALLREDRKTPRKAFVSFVNASGSNGLTQPMLEVLARNTHPEIYFCIWTYQEHWVYLNLFGIKG